MLFGKKFNISIAVTFGQVLAHFRFGGALVDRMALMVRKNNLFVWLVGILDCLLSLLVLVVMVVSIVDYVGFFLVHYRTLPHHQHHHQHLCLQHQHHHHYLHYSATNTITTANL